MVRSRLRLADGSDLLADREGYNRYVCGLDEGLRFGREKLKCMIGRDVRQGANCGSG